MSRTAQTQSDSDTNSVCSPPKNCHSVTTKAIKLSPIKKLLFTCVAVSLVVLAIGVGGEIILRSLAPKSDGVQLGMALDNSDRGRGLVPNVRSLHKGVDVSINSIGFREKEYAIEKPAGMKRIVVLGDSFTFGVGVEFSEIYPKRLEKMLNRSGSHCEVINFGVGGYNTQQELATFREVAVSYDPDLIILAYVLNDVQLLPKKEPQGLNEPTSDSPSSKRRWLNNVHGQLKDFSLLYAWLSPGVGILLEPFGLRYAVGRTAETITQYESSSLGWQDTQRAILDLADEAQGIDAEFVVIIFPYILDFAGYPFASIHEKIRQFCTQNNISCVDMLKRFKNENASELKVFLDGHPNARAHEIFAEEIFKHLNADATRMLE